jgi:hypothetical protein
MTAMEHLNARHFNGFLVVLGLKPLLDLLGRAGTTHCAGHSHDEFHLLSSLLLLEGNDDSPFTNNLQLEVDSLLLVRDSINILHKIGISFRNHRLVKVCLGKVVQDAIHHIPFIET